jgi:hypothetical protein
MAAPVRTKIDLSQLGSADELGEPGRGRPVLKLVPPLVEPAERPAPKPQVQRRRSAAGRHRSQSRAVTCTPVVRRRRRVAVSVLVGLGVFLGVLGFGLFAGAMGEGAVPERTAVVWVEPGETLWEVAERSAPGYDTEAVIARIHQLNEIPGNGVLAGQAIEVPSAP